MQSEEEQYSSILLNVKQIVAQFSKNSSLEKWFKYFEEIEKSTDNERIRDILKTLIEKQNDSELKEFLRILLETQKIDIGEKKQINKYNDEEIKQFLEIVDNDYEYFRNLLLHNGQYALALIIDPYVRDVIDFSQCDPSKGYVHHFSFGDKNPKEEFKVEEGKLPNSKSNAYDMKGDPKGICYLLINYLTIAIYKEMQRFRNIFHKLNFKVIMRKNMNANEIMEELEELSKREELKKHKAFIFMTISHGNAKGEIIGFDNKPLKIEGIMNLFNNENCPQLLRRPKVFFFNCCRGNKKDDGVNATLATSEDANADGEIVTSIFSKVPTNSHLYIIYSTLYGYEAEVKWNEGTIFGKVLADSIIERVLYRDINGILTLANNTLEEKYPSVRQRFESRHMGARDMFFINE